MNTLPVTCTPARFFLVLLLCPQNNPSRFCGWEIFRCGARNFLAVIAWEMTGETPGETVLDVNINLQFQSERKIHFA